MLKSVLAALAALAVASGAGIAATGSPGPAAKGPRDVPLLRSLINLEYQEQGCSDAAACVKVRYQEARVERRLEHRWHQDPHSR
ncbi:MAG TPA: hypothetical protein VFI54_06255 [Solirubrobacteraceae bacterium]|nr:hypothetical protein [Solirubrobacteraceae bacterium]